MRRMLLGIYSLLIIMAIYLAAYGLPALQKIYELSRIQFNLLIIVSSLFFVILMAALFEYIVTIPLNEFIKNILKTWERGKSLESFVVKPLYPELKEILDVTKKITKINSNRVRELEGKSGYTDSYYRLISTMSHQLRTPITGLRWALGTIQDDLAQGKTPESSLISKMYEATIRSTAIIEDLLTGVRQQDFGATKSAPVDIEQCLNEIISESSLTGKERSIDISVTHTSGKIPLIMGNRQQVSFVIHSIIANAIYYGTPGSTVNITTKHDGSKIQVDVSNAGKPIPKEDRSMLFSQFYRSTEAIRLNPNGAGLSLYMAKQILLDHGGSISFISTTENTTFTITLPLSHGGELEKSVRY